jgi:hypothetical protein
VDGDADHQIVFAFEVSVHTPWCICDWYVSLDWGHFHMFLRENELILAWLGPGAEFYGSFVGVVKALGGG